MAVKLQDAVYDFDPAALKNLLTQSEVPIDVMESTDDTQYTLLLTAISISDEGNEEDALAIAKLLVERGANVNHVRS